MNSTVAFFDKDLQKIRAGKASPQMLEGLKVDYYGNPTPVEQVANINTPDAHQIVIQPWERNMLPVIERFYTEKRLKNMALILNGTKVTTGRHHRQGYGYGYGYGSYTKEEA